MGGYAAGQIFGDVLLAAIVAAALWKIVAWRRSSQAK